MTVGVDFGITQVVDGNWGVHGILKKSLFGSWLLIFIIGTRELSTAMFLSGPQTRVISVLTLELSEQGQYEMLSAISVLLLTVTGVVTLIGTIILGRDFMLRRT